VEILQLVLSTLLLQLEIQAHAGAKYNTDKEATEAKHEFTKQQEFIRNTTTKGK
jgi:hypothetical protein